MKQKRIFHFDFVRTIAVILVIICHFNAVYLSAVPPIVNRNVFPQHIFHEYIGNIGTSLFFIISGAVLFLNYEHNFNIKKFYSKRFWAIYPMFYIAYLIAMNYYIINKMSFFHKAPGINFIFTILGIDWLMYDFVPTFGIVGEWFLGCIIIIYLIFPILRYFFIKYPKTFMAIIMIIYCVAVWCIPISEKKVRFFYIRLPEFVFGMFFVKYMKKVKLWQFILAIMAIVLVTYKYPNWDPCIHTTYIGISTCIILLYVANYLSKVNIVRRFCQFISKYSYAIFLIHHFIIILIMRLKNLQVISMLESYLLFGICLICILIGAIGIYKINHLLFATKS